MLRQFGVLLAASVVFSYLAALLVTWCLPPSDVVGDEPGNDSSVFEQRKAVTA